MTITSSIKRDYLYNLAKNGKRQDGRDLFSILSTATLGAHRG